MKSFIERVKVRDNETKESTSLNYIKLSNPATFLHRKQLLESKFKSKLRSRSGQSFRIFYSIPFSEWDPEEAKVRVYIRDKWPIGEIELVSRHSDNAWILRHVNDRSESVLKLFTATPDFYLWSPTSSFTLIGSRDSCVVSKEEANDTVLVFVEEEDNPFDSAFHSLAKLHNTIELRFENGETMECHNYELIQLGFKGKNIRKNNEKQVFAVSGSKTQWEKILDFPCLTQLFDESFRNIFESHQLIYTCGDVRIRLSDLIIPRQTDDIATADVVRVT